MKHCLVFASLISPSKMILFEKKYQTFDTVFHHQMKHLEVRQKYSAARRIFNSLLGVSSGDETLHLMFDILHQKFSILFGAPHQLSSTERKVFFSSSNCPMRTFTQNNATHVQICCIRFFYIAYFLWTHLQNIWKVTLTTL